MSENEILSDLHIRIVDAYHTVLVNKYWNRPEECDPFARFYIIRSGEATTHVAGELKKFTPENLYIIPSHTKFQHHDSPGFDHYWLHFQALLPSGLSLFEIIDCDWQVPASVIPDAFDIAERIVNLYNSHHFLDIIELRSLLTGIFCQFLRHSQIKWKTDPGDIKRFIPILQYIEDNISSPITIDELADISKLHPQYFSVQFSNCFKKPPIRFINEKRMEKAQFYLVNSNMQIKEIAAKIGYSDEYYFSRIFKQIIGITPSKFRYQKKSYKPEIKGKFF